MNNENIIDDKIKNVISMIKSMDLKNKLRLGVCISSSAYTNLRYNKARIHNIFNKGVLIKFAILCKMWYNYK